MAERRRSRTVRPTRMNWSFIEVLTLLFAFGLTLEVLSVAQSRSANTGLWIFIGFAGLIGLMWLVAREPANL